MLILRDETLSVASKLAGQIVGGLMNGAETENKKVKNESAKRVKTLNL